MGSRMEIFSGVDEGWIAITTTSISNAIYISCCWINANHSYSFDSFSFVYPPEYQRQAGPFECQGKGTYLSNRKFFL